MAMLLSDEIDQEMVVEGDSSCMDEIDQEVVKGDSSYVDEISADVEVSYIYRALVNNILSRGGEVISPYDPKSKHVTIKCDKGHEWQTSYKNVLYRNTWCPFCYGNVSHTIETMRELALGRGGKCISDKYGGLALHLEWECSAGHTWHATPNNVKNHGSWCPNCKINVGEEIIRATLEEAFPDHTFNRTRSVDFMQGLELDGYNNTLKLAFEYQGIQHYKKVDFFHRTEGSFEAQLERDRLTKERCEQNGVKLLIISYKIKNAALRDYVRDRLTEFGFIIAPMADNNTKFYNRIRSDNVKNQMQLARAKEICIRKGGICLSETYVGYRAPLTIYCNNHGGIFYASLEAIDQPIKRGKRFCNERECNVAKKHTPEMLKQSVESRGYTFLGHGTRFSGGKNRTYMNVICNVNHAPYAVDASCFNSTLDGKPRGCCGVCAAIKLANSRRTDIEEWSEKTGVVPVTPFRNKTLTQQWRCSVGHNFSSTLKLMESRNISEACFICCLLNYTAENNITILDQIEIIDNHMTKLNCRCERNHAFKHSFSSMIKYKGTDDSPCSKCRH